MGQRLLPFENAADIDAGAAKGVRVTGTVAHQTAGHDEFAQMVARRQRMTGGQRNYLSAPAVVKRTSADEQRASLAPDSTIMAKAASISLSVPAFTITI
jgi:hypothetical protein